MWTLTRNGRAKHGAGAQVSNKSGDGYGALLFKGLSRALTHAPRGPGAASRLSVTAVLLLTALAHIVAPAAYAADPQPYRVDMASTNDSELDATLKATSDLLTLRKSAPVGPFGLIGRGQGDLERLKTVLDSFGFYQSYVAITIDGLPLDAPTLGEELTARASGDDAQVKITFSIGPMYHVRKVDIDGEVPKSVTSALGLATGMPAIAADVLAAGERLQTALEDQGYAFAKVDPPIAYEDPPNRVLDVSFKVVAGAEVKIGTIRIRGLKNMKESFVRKRLLVHTGDRYGATKIEQARKDLLGLGVFSSVSVDIGKQADSEGRVPLTFRARERLLHGVSVSAAYSSDLGGSTGVTWTDRNVSGKADQLTLAATAINLGGSATTGIGYDTSAKYLIPEFKQRDQTLQVSVGALRQSLDAYDQTAFTSGVTVNRKLSPIWSVSAGFSAEQERIDQESIAQRCIDKSGAPLPSCTDASGNIVEDATLLRQIYHYTLFALPLGILYNTTGLDSPLEDPRHGVRASLNVTPTLSIGRPKNTQFIVTQANVALFLDLKDLGFGFSRDPGRSVLALRALAGIAAGAGELSLPPDQRFYAGGSGTIRGYRYQSVGPEFSVSHNPIGGTAINAGTAEYRQRIGQNFGMAVFLDGGQVSANLNPLAGTLRFGTGAGVRYYTPIGPIRLDLAVPIARRKDALTGRYTDDAFEIYIGLGQAF